MLDWLFGRKKEPEKLRDDVKNGFEAVKTDINSLTSWVKHLDKQDNGMDLAISDIKEEISTIKNDIEGLKNTFAFMEQGVFKQVFKTPRRNLSKQTAVQAVQDAVQTPVQTGVLPILSNFSVTERAIIMVLLNSDLKLSYDDLAAMLGKSRATIRGQINSIKQKSDSLVDEQVEKNGKKRVYIPLEIREKMLKSVKVRVNRERKNDKNELLDENDD